MNIRRLHFIFNTRFFKWLSYITTPSSDWYNSRSDSIKTLLLYNLWTFAETVHHHRTGHQSGGTAKAKQNILIIEVPIVPMPSDYVIMICTLVSVFHYFVSEDRGQRVSFSNFVCIASSAKKAELWKISWNSSMCSSARKSLVKGERFMRGLKRNQS